MMRPWTTTRECGAHEMSETEDALDLVLWIYDRWGDVQEEDYPPNYSAYQIEALQHADKCRTDGARTALSQAAFELFKKLHPGSQNRHFVIYCDERRLSVKDPTE